MEKYFDIRYEFDVPTVHTTIDEYIANDKTGYICVADGNILTTHEWKMSITILEPILQSLLSCR